VQFKNLKLIEESFDKFGQQQPRDLLQNPLLQKDIWLVKEDLGLSIPAHRSLRTINFILITNDWFKLCLQLYTLLRIKSGSASGTVHRGVVVLTRFFKFLTQHSVNDFGQINNQIFEAYEYHLVGELKLRPRTVEGHLSNLAMFFDTCRLEGWFDVNTYWFKGKRPRYNQLLRHAEIEYIPEEVWNQLDQSLKYLPEPIQRMVILLRCTGVRIGELCNLPLDCLRKRGEQWRIRFTTEKYDIEDELPIVMPELVAVIKEQQSYIKEQFGEIYDKLFCGSLSGKQYLKRSTDVTGIQKLVFYPKPETMSWGSFSHLLNRLAQMCNIRTREGKLWHFRSHQFRRTVATVMTNAGVRDLIIQKYLRHRSPRMLLHYQHFLKQAMQSEYEELLREKKYVDISGKVVANHKPTNPLTELMRRQLYQITTQYGECHRPILKSPCQTVNACWRCEHWRTSTNDLPYLKDDLERVEKELEIASSLSMMRQKQGLEEDRNNLLHCIRGLESIDG